MAKTQRKENQNKQLDKEALAAKYGDTKVGVVALTPELKTALGNGGFISPDTMIERNGATPGAASITKTPIHFDVSTKMDYRLRCEAEIDEDYLQPIPYCILETGERDAIKYFCTKRIGSGGDERLSGLRSIGLGGHVDDGETPTNAFYRELQEEVGVSAVDIFTVKRLGYIYDNTTAVGKVHLGLVYVVSLKHSNVRVKETDKLSGEWLNLSTLEDIRKNGKLESWSEMCVDVLKKAQK